MCLLLLTATGASACGKVAAQLGLGARLSDSALAEYASNGRLLVKEHGVLAGSGLNASLRCDRWTVGLDLLSVEGRRDYSGQTSLGTALTTSSQIGDGTASASLYRAITDTVHLGVDVSQQHSTRDILSTALAAGYPEAYERTFIRVGARWEIPSATGLWTLLGAISVYAEQSMSLRLPGRDASTLKFAQPSQWEVGAKWRKELDSHMYMELAYHYIHTDADQSPYAVVTSGGVPVGVAYQPRTTLVDQPVSASIGISF